MKNYKLLLLLSLFTGFFPVVFPSSPARASVESARAEVAECSICLQHGLKGGALGWGLALLGLNEHPSQVGCCGGWYHKQCLNEWIPRSLAQNGRATCPSCRADLEAAPADELYLEEVPASPARETNSERVSVPYCRTLEFYQLSPSSPVLGCRWVYTPVFVQGMPAPAEAEEYNYLGMPSSFGAADDEFLE